MGSSLFQTSLADISDATVLALISELESACAVSSDSFKSVWFYHYVWQCVYPEGASEKRRPIDKNKIIPGGLLDTKIGKLRNTQIYPFCHELAMKLKSQSVELVENTKLYVFLNRYLPVIEKQKKSKNR